MLKRVAIIGAGISGLTAGYALTKKGIQVDIFERSQSIDEFGAGITLSKNATSLLDDIGLLESIAAKGYRPLGSYIRDFKTTKVISSMKLDKNFITIDRRNLVEELFNRSQELGCNILLNTTIESIDAAKGIVNSSSNSQAKYDLILVCDGINSIVRQSLFGGQKPKFTGYVAWRGMTTKEAVPLYEGSLKANVYYGPGAHFVHYPTGLDDKVNFLMIERSSIWTEESWKLEGDKSDLLNRFEGWNKDIVSMLNTADKIYKWGIFERSLPKKLFSEKCVLLGDAAHPMVPFLGQGGCMAVEDAYCLSSLVTEKKYIHEALTKYDQLRNARCKWIQRRSRLQGIFNHVSSPFIVPVRNIFAKFTMKLSVEKLHSYNLITELRS